MRIILCIVSVLFGGLSMIAAFSQVKREQKPISAILMIFGSLLLLAAVPALVVAFHIHLADLTIHTLMDATGARFAACFGLALGLMALIIVAGIWYPARRAMKIQPAEALHDE